MVTFESGSKLSRIEQHAFCFCEELKSICIPASVEILRKSCFECCFGLTELEFERGSQLTRIESFALKSCDILKSLCIPSSVSSIDVSAFVHARVGQLTVEDGNTHFSASDGFLLDFAGIRLLRFIGRSYVQREAIVGSKIQILATGSFVKLTGLGRISLAFANGSELREIEEGAFDDNCGIEDIRIPGSIELLHRNWASSASFTKLIFESGQSLQHILEENSESIGETWNIYIPWQNRDLAFRGYSVSGTCDVPGFVRLIKNRKLNE
jgi:hypothetical protein